MKLSIELKGNKIPAKEHMLVVSIIKNALKSSSEDYYHKLYFYGDKSNKQSKNFSTALFKSNYRFDGEDCIVEGKIFLTITSPDAYFLNLISNGVMKMQKILYKNYFLEIGRVRLENQSIISGRAAVCKTISPLLIKNKSRGLDFDEPGYEKELNYMCDLILKNYRGKGLSEPLIFVPLEMEKQIVKMDLREFTDHEGPFMENAYKGMFILGGATEDLNMLIQLGIGWRRSQSFGQIECVSEMPGIQRPQTY